MPLYDFSCPHCNKVIRDQFLHITAPAPICCDNSMVKIFDQFKNKPEIFHEGFYEHIADTPLYIKSKKQLREETRKRGLTSDYAEG